MKIRLLSIFHTIFINFNNTIFTGKSSEILQNNYKLTGRNVIFQTLSFVKNYNIIFTNINPTYTFKNNTNSDLDQDNVCFPLPSQYSPILI